MAICKELFFRNKFPKELIVNDLVQCFKLSPDDSSEFLLEAIIQAVRYGKSFMYVCVLCVCVVQGLCDQSWCPYMSRVSH